MKVLIIDNYDSFTYNLYQLVGEILLQRGSQFELKVIRNDEWDLTEIESWKADRIIISPGPGDPSDKSYFGVCGDVITQLGKKTPVFGVCLGMQGICHYFGGEVIPARVPMHGKTSLLKHNSKGVFKGLPQDLEIMRYHSLVANSETLPSELEITCWVGDFDSGYEIMGLKHTHYPIEGIQFHPESFATEGGKEIIKAYLL